MTHTADIAFESLDDWYRGWT